MKGLCARARTFSHAPPILTFRTVASRGHQSQTTAHRFCGASSDRRASDQAKRMLFMTGGAFTVHGQEFMQALGDGYLAKPFRPLEVCTTIHRWLSVHGLASDATGGNS